MLRSKLTILISILALVSVSCQFSFPSVASTATSQTAKDTMAVTPTPSNETPSNSVISPEPSSSVINPVGSKDPDEPVFISGDIPYTSPFFLNSAAEPFVMLEDEAGFVKRDREFLFPLKGQTIGPVEIDKDKKLTYYLTLPSLPQGTLVDVDNDGAQDIGVQIFQVAYWSNIWGDPFLEERDGKGWSTAYTSAVTDPENEDEIVGGKLLIWSPDDQQGFPTGFGKDGKLFTEDDPTANIPRGYNLVDLDQDPFQVYKESEPYLTLYEGEGAVKDYSELSYGDAFKSLFEKASREYPFTEEKNIDWDELKDKFTPIIESAQNTDQFFRGMRDFTMQIPDGHVGLSFNRDVFYEDFGGGFGLVLSELSDGKIVAREVIAESAAERAGILPGAELITWNGLPVGEAVSKVVPGFGPASTPHAKRLNQIQFLVRVPPDAKVEVSFMNPESEQEEQATLVAEVEYESLFNTIPSFNQDELALPIEANVLEDKGIGYVRINSFNDDYNLMARLWERYVQNLIDNEVPGLIIDLRTNSGGSAGLAMDFAGYFFDKEIPLYENFYYNDNLGDFKKTDYPTTIKPAPLNYAGPIAVLVSPDCASACEAFAYALQQDNRSVIVGHYPTAGMFGEVGLGQYKLPDEISLQFPTGKSMTEDGQLVLEGVGVVPDITVPMTLDSVLGKVDALLEAAVKAVSEKLN